MSFRSAFVVLVLAGSLALTSCANDGLGPGLGPGYCQTGTLDPACITGPSPTPRSGALQVPTQEIRPKIDGDPTKDFPAVIQLLSLSPAAGTLSTPPIRFSWNMRIRADYFAPRASGGLNYWLYPSNDGVTKIGGDFTNGYITTFGVDWFSPDGTPGMITLMPVSFNYILVELSIYLNGTGEIRSHHAFKVDYAE